VKTFPTVNVRLNPDKLKNIEKDRILPTEKIKLKKEKR